MFRVLDYSHSAQRLFNNFYTFEQNVDGLYDIIIVQRHSFQDDIDIIKNLLNTDGIVIIDITSESGCIDNFFIDYYNKIIADNQSINFILISEFDSPRRLNFDNVKLAIDNRLLETIFSPLYKTDSDWSNIPFNVFHKKNTILSLNGSARLHRTLLLLHLYKNNLIDRLEYSFRCYDHSDVTKFQSDVFDDMVNELKQDNVISDSDVDILFDIKKKLPMIIDEYDGKPNEKSIEIFNSMVNLVTENVYGYFCCGYGRPSMSITEKTLKPFMTHNIPIVVALPKTISYMRDLGYDVFDDLIDHSYDNEYDEVKRMSMIIDELKRIIDFDFVSFYNKNKQRFVKNRELVYSRSIGGYIFLRDFLIENKLF